MKKRRDFPILKKRWFQVEQGKFPIWEIKRAPVVSKYDLSVIMCTPFIIEDGVKFRDIFLTRLPVRSVCRSRHITYLVEAAHRLSVVAWQLSSE